VQYQIRCPINKQKNVIAMMMIMATTEKDCHPMSKH